jgi:predicted Zn-dependent protease with MMP-like domain
MILLDLSQVMISNIMVQVGPHTDAIQPDLVRHMVINTIRSLKTKFGSEFGELVIACDDRKYWRREAFPPYKGNRKADREKSSIDWPALFDTLNQIKQELKENFPYRVIQVEGAEADDVIGSLCMKFGTDLNNNDRIMILSGDKDFVQLQVYGNVLQHDPVRKKDITSTNPQKFKQHLILSGDRGDGIPNVLSPDNSIIEGLRQKPLRETKIEEILKADFNTLPEEIKRNWSRNTLLIDLQKIPQTLQDRILAEYHSQADKPRDKMFNYFIKHKMKLLMESIGDF